MTFQNRRDEAASKWLVTAKPHDLLAIRRSRVAIARVGSSFEHLATRSAQERHSPEWRTGPAPPSASCCWRRAEPASSLELKWLTAVISYNRRIKSKQVALFKESKSVPISYDITELLSLTHKL